MTVGKKKRPNKTRLCPVCRLVKPGYDWEGAQRRVAYAWEESGLALKAYPCGRRWHLSRQDTWQPGQWKVPEPKLL